nr:MAG TPA: YopX protein [Bacteriophage sp.]
MKAENIKFKAKQLNSGKWFEGDLVHLGNRVCIGGDHIKDGITDVDPSTVCQFTGMMDEDCNEIWEGDIVRDNDALLCIDNLYEVVYIEEEGTFAFKSLDKVDNYEPFVNLFKVHVIGNKFDKEK